MTEDFNEEAAVHWDHLGDIWLAITWGNILFFVGACLSWVRTDSTLSFWAVVASTAFWFVCAYFARLYYGRAAELRSDHGKPGLS